MSTHPRRRHIHVPTTVGDRAADALTTFAGSWAFVGIHVAWFALWLLLHLDINLLTLIVSLEAIFLATFVLMSQNRQATRDRSRDDTEAREVEEMFRINQQQMQILEQQNQVLDQQNTVMDQQTEQLALLKQLLEPQGTRTRRNNAEEKA